MFKKTLYGLLFSASLLASGPSNAQTSENVCLTLGGTALAQAIDSTRFLGALTGSFAGGARAEVTSEEKTASGLKLGMEHFFLTSKAGLLRTKDVAILTQVKGRENVFMIEINYDIQDASGSFEGYSGDFQSFGLADLNTGKVALRYKGEICK